MTALHSFRAYSELALAMLMLFSCFTIPALPGVRAGLRAALGQTRYLVAHSAVAGVFLLWLVSAALRVAG